MTEGFADAFETRSGFHGLNADTGTRFFVNDSGFPAGASLFVPTVVASSDAVEPTAGGDFGPPASGGKYAPGGSGSLLLSLVQFAIALMLRMRSSIALVEMLAFATTYAV